MAYCINCGVDLAPSESKCPLCGAPAVPPGIIPEKSVCLPVYEAPAKPRMERHALLFLLTVGFLLPIILCFVCDLKLHGGLEWAGFAAACLALVYLAVVIPITLRPPLLLQLAIDWAGAEVLLFYIARALDAGWFWPLAFPIALFPCAAAAILHLLRRAAHWGGLDVAALACLSAGFNCLFIEWRINVVFAICSRFAWAQYPFFTLLAVAALLFITGRNRSLKEKLARRFFI